MQEVMPCGTHGEAVHGGGEDQPHGVHLGDALHWVRYLRQEGARGFLCGRFIAFVSVTFRYPGGGEILYSQTLVTVP